MEFTKRICLFIIIIGLCASTYKQFELIHSFISTMESILQFCYIVSAVILIMLRKDRNTENNYTREPSSVKRNSVVKQNPMETVKYNQTSRENSTIKQKVPTAAVNGTKRNARLQKDFLSTSPGKIRVRGKNCPKTAVSEAVRENIDLIENDLKVKESSLLDEMQGYLSEEDVIKITRSSRKDQAHFFAEIIEDLNGNSFLHVLNILNETSFGHISKELKKSYEKYLPSQLPSTLCPICRIQSEVDIKSLRCGLIREELLPKNLKKDINNCQTLKGHQNVLWQELFYHLKMMQPKQNITEKFINIFKDAKHGSIFSYLSLHGLPCFDCTCDRNPSIETDTCSLRATSSLNLNASDESTTSSIEMIQEPQWFNDAVHSSSSEEGVKPATMKSTKRTGIYSLKMSSFPPNIFDLDMNSDAEDMKMHQLLERSKHSIKKKKIAKARTKTGNKSSSPSSTLSCGAENSHKYTTTLDSYSRLNIVHVSDITSTTHGINRQHRAVKRAMKPENRPTTEIGDLPTMGGLRKSTSEPLLKLPYKAEESLRKRLKVLSVRPFMSNSDRISEEEAMKISLFPANHQASMLRSVPEFCSNSSLCRKHRPNTC